MVQMVTIFRCLDLRVCRGCVCGPVSGAAVAGAAWAAMARRMPPPSHTRHLAVR